MKRSFLIALVMFCLVGIRAMAGTDYIANSKHNFSSYSWSGGEICKPCHTPHFSTAEEVSTRLWNHTLSTSTYTIAGGATAAQTDMDKSTRLCLSCHDGTVALDSFGGATGTNFVPNTAKLGTDLSNDHPVGNKAVVKDETEGGRFKPVTYGSSLTSSGKIGALSIYPASDGSTHTATVAGATVTRANLVVSCYTCHTAHGAGIGGASSPNLLRISNASSGICLSCHYK